MPPFARASELDRLFECVGSAVLPRASDAPDYVKPAASARGAMWGSVCHRWKETGVIPDNVAWAGPLDKKIKASKIDRFKQWPEGGEHEVAMALNVVTGRVMRCVPPIGASDDYKDAWKRGFNDEWVTGTLDYVWELVGVPWVDDLKTGRILSVHEYLAQQSFYCLAWDLVAYEKPVDTRSTLTHWPRYPLESGPRRFGSVLEADYLAAFRKKLGKLRDRILSAKDKESKMKLADGPHCRFCPSKDVCPKVRETKVD